MNKRDIEALEKLMEDWRSPNALPYSSDPEFESGMDCVYEDAADDLALLIKQLNKGKKDK